MMKDKLTGTVRYFALDPTYWLLAIIVCIVAQVFVVERWLAILTLALFIGAFVAAAASDE